MTRETTYLKALQHKSVKDNTVKFVGTYWHIIICAYTTASEDSNVGELLYSDITNTVEIEKINYIVFMGDFN